MANRMTVSKRVRFEVFKRDGFRCRYCAKQPPDTLLEVDHVVPVCEGGGNDMGNLVTACQDCNRGKAGVPLDSVVPPESQEDRLWRLQELMEEADAIRHQVAAHQAKERSLGTAMEECLAKWLGIGGRDDSFNESSIRTFLRKGDLATIMTAFEATDVWWTQNDRKPQWAAWKYFCGVMWRLIKERTDA